MENDTIIVVATTRMDTYGNLFVTPKGGGDEVKIGSKRSQLHELFEQGKAVMLHWETYKGKAYVSDAKLVEGELPEPQPSDQVLPEHKKVIDEVIKTPPAPQAVGMVTNNICQLIIADKLTAIFGKKIGIELVKWYRGQVLGITRINYDGKELPEYKVD